VTYFGKRYLIPALGRWASADPLAVHSPGSADLNVYAYVRGQLLRATDPTGLDCDQDGNCRTNATGGDVSRDTTEGGKSEPAPKATPIPARQSPYMQVWNGGGGTGPVAKNAADALSQAESILRHNQDVLNAGVILTNDVGLKSAARQNADALESITEQRTFAANQAADAKTVQALADRAHVEETIRPYLPSTAQVPSVLSAPPGSGGGGSSVGLLALGAGLAAGGGSDMETIFHGTTSNRASKIVQRGFRSQQGITFFSRSYDVAEHFALDAASSTGARSSTVLILRVPRALASQLTEHELGALTGAKPIDIAGGDARELLLQGDAHAAFNRALLSGEIRHTRWRVNGTRPPSAR
jgi:hypothetical protein